MFSQLWAHMFPAKVTICQFRSWWVFFMQAFAFSVVIMSYLLTELRPSWEAANCAAIQEIPSNFKEPKGSSPCSQEPSTGPYPEPVRSSPYHPILSLPRSILILSTHLRLGLPSGLLPSGFPTKILYAFLVATIRATCPARGDKGPT
jgi:hypothetical protein